MKKILTALFLMSAVGCAETEIADDVSVDESEVEVDCDAGADFYPTTPICIPGGHDPICGQLPDQSGDSTCGPCDHNPKPPSCCASGPGPADPGPAPHKMTELTDSDPYQELLEEFLQTSVAAGVTVDQYWPFPGPRDYPWPGPSNGGCHVYTTAVCCTVGGHTICWPRTDTTGG